LAQRRTECFFPVISLAEAEVALSWSKLRDACRIARITPSRGSAPQSRRWRTAARIAREDRPVDSRRRDDQSVASAGARGGRGRAAGRSARGSGPAVRAMTIVLAGVGRCPSPESSIRCRWPIETIT